ncbi:lysosomal membrane ascorbate-dependent ferrireductase CYB561A3-like [Adelges cooleyi]|uniref:lysosomal membrane ascorbate-dependent ferrireductase CYB561A3-like n=1 Tax=Adelges cooleyi TaxID=133065 RepID=UPI00217F61A7|nr:lysosomal membrane ascorbate-dependent ferrireductase CYB561A3-like [Adelges cooleyi]
MYALQTVGGSTTSSVKDDSEVLELEDAANSIAEQIISKSAAVKDLENPTANGTANPAQHVKNNYESNSGYNEEGEISIGLLLWTCLQAFGLASVAAIVCISVIYKEGYFGESGNANSAVINKTQIRNWHYTLSTVGFIYLYGNSMFMIKKSKKNTTLPYIMLHTFALLVSALSVFLMVVRREMGKSNNSLDLKSMLFGHLYSLHSWIGATTMLFFTLQWLTAVITFAMPCFHRIGLPLGKQFSMYTIVIATSAILTGVNEHAVYSLNTEYMDYSSEGLALNSFGILVLIFSLLTIYAMVRKRN